MNVTQIKNERRLLLQAMDECLEMNDTINKLPIHYETREKLLDYLGRVSHTIVTLQTEVYRRDHYNQPEGGNNE